MTSNLGNKKIMAQNIQYYMTIYGKTRQEMCDALGVKYTTFTDWVKGNVYPRIDKIELMANYFGISKSDLVEERATKGKPETAMDYLDTTTIKQLNRANIDKVNVYSRNLLNIQNMEADSSMPILNAAHEIEGSSDEDKQHDEELLNKLYNNRNKG